MDNFQGFLRVALESINTMTEGLNAHHAAVIVKGGNILSIGINRPKMNSYVKFYGNHENCGSIHAELDAIFRVRRKIDLSGCKLYVARLTKRGVVGMSAPCGMCKRVIQSYGIKRVYYTVDENTYAVMKIPPAETKWKKK